MLEFFKKRKLPYLDESKIDFNIKKELEQTFIKKHVLSEKARKIIKMVLTEHPQNIIVASSHHSWDITNFKLSRKYTEQEVESLKYMEFFMYLDAYFFIWNESYEPLIYWNVISGDIYIHPDYCGFDITENQFELTDNYDWEVISSEVKDELFLVDTKIKGYKCFEWSASVDAPEFHDLVEIFNITGAILRQGYEETNEIIEEYNVHYELYGGFMLINGDIHPEFLKKYYNINGNQGTICEMAIFVDMDVPITKEMIKGKYIDIKHYKTILPIDDRSDIMCFFNF
ncbi:hypothetical protein [Macrococcus equi]|uniref:hypothetical protein n=1 Tax=Macrococcus equi TaxID=3395462 RepID=UPI0039BDA6B0